MLVNPPQILFPHITKRRVDVGGTVCVVGVGEDKRLQVYNSLRTEISLAEYEEDIPEVPTGVTETKVNDNQLEDPMSFAQAVVNSLTTITQNKQFLLGVIHIECNGFESIIDFNEEHHFEIDIKSLMEAFLTGRIHEKVPDLLKAPLPSEIPLFIHHEKADSILNFTWKVRQDLFLQLEGLTGTVYGIGTVEDGGGQAGLHLYVLEDALSNINLLGKPVAYPKTLDEVIEKVKNKSAFPLVWFRFDFGFPFAFAQFPEWENACQLGVFKEAKDAYDAYAVQSIAGLEKGEEIEIEEDLLPEDEKTKKKRLKAIKQGKYDPIQDMAGAIEFFSSLLGADADLPDSAVVQIAENDPELWYSRSMIARQEGSLDKAKNAIEKAIRFELERIKKTLLTTEDGATIPASAEIKPPQPLLAKYWHEYGIIFNLLQDSKDAIFAFKNTVSFDPENETYGHDLANTLLSANQLQEASALLVRILQKSPANAYGWFKVGELQFRSKQFKAAQASFQKASELVPNNPSFVANLGSTCLLLQDWDGALEAFKRSILLDSNQVNYWIGLGVAYAGKTHPVEGNTLLAHLSKLMDKSTADHHYVLGLARLALGRNKQALQKFNDAKVLNENNYQMWKLIADLSEKEGNLNSVATALVNMDRLQPDQIELLEHLASVRQRLRNWDMAVETYRRLLNIRPWEPKYWNTLGTSLMYAKGNPAEILDVFQKATEQDRTNIKYLNNLAWQQFTMNLFPEALASAERVLNIDKNNIPACNTIACVIYKQGEQLNEEKLLGQARKEFDRLLKEVPENEWDKSINLKLALKCLEKTGKDEKIEIIKKHLTATTKGM